MKCQACGYDVQPYDDLGSDMRIVARCPRGECNSLFRAATLEPTPTAVAAPRVTKPSSSPPVKPSVARKAAAPRDVLSVAKGRLGVVERRLEAMRRLELEAAQLRRMIYAAEGDQPIKQINGYANAPTWKA